MKYEYNSFLNGKSKTSIKTGMKLLVIENIKRQKKIVNNDKRYSEEEKKLILKGLDMAIDRVWTSEEDLLNR